MASIQGIYLAFFGRPADPLGLAYWEEQTNGGADLSVMLNALSGTEEYQARFVGMSNAEVIESIYEALFGRAPEAEGLAHFLEALESGTQTLGSIAVNILDGAQGTDLAIIENKIAAAEAFTASLDTPEEIAAYSGDAAADFGRAFINQVTEDPTTVPTAEEVQEQINNDLPIKPTTPTTPDTTGGNPGGVTPANPTFSLVETDGTYEFGGSATGIITVSIEDDVATFSRGGLTAAKTISLDDWVPGENFLRLAGQTLELTPQQADRLSEAAEVPAEHASTTQYNFLSGTGTVHITSSKIAAGEVDLFSIHPDITVKFADVDVEIEEGGFLEIHPQHADGIVISGDGKVSISLHDYPTEGVTLDVRTNEYSFIGGTGGNDKISVTGTGNKLIYAGGGADEIILDEVASGIIRVRGDSNLTALQEALQEALNADDYDSEYSNSLLPGEDGYDEAKAAAAKAVDDALDALTVYTPASWSFWRDGGGTWDVVRGFEPIPHWLELEAGELLVADGVVNGVAAFEVGELADKVQALAEMIGDDSEFAAFVHNEDTYVFMNLDGEASISSADIFVQLVGVQLTSLHGVVPVYE